MQLVGNGNTKLAVTHFPTNDQKYICIYAQKTYLNLVSTPPINVNLPVIAKLHTEHNNFQQAKAGILEECGKSINTNDAGVLELIPADF